MLVCLHLVYSDMAVTDETDRTLWDDSLCVKRTRQQCNINYSSNMNLTKWEISKAKILLAKDIREGTVAPSMGPKDVHGMLKEYQQYPLLLTT